MNYKTAYKKIIINNENNINSKKKEIKEIFTIWLSLFLNN
jgi:hypothetical protein